MDGSTPFNLNIAPLIPLPATTAKGEEKEDIFATLFSPPTPRASPTQTPEPTVVGRHARHARTESTESDFGAFVSVPAAEDPLGSGSGPEPAPFTPLQNYEFFDKFAEDAKAASEKKRREVLDELLQHEDDPLYWLQGASSSTSQTTHHPPAISQSSSLGESLIDLDSPSDTRAPMPANIPSFTLDVSAMDQSGRSTPRSIQTSSTTSDVLIDVDQPLADPDDARNPRHRTQTSPQHSPKTTHLRSPSLPPQSPSRLSSPEIQRTQSSYFTPPAIPASWVSNLLSNTIRAPRVSPSTPPSEVSAASIFANPLQDSSAPSSRFSTLSRSTPHSRAATISEGTSVDTSITHGTPFASHPFIPPSGAPGFTGDRQWDKGFEFDKTQVERKSVRLTGRKDVTAPVLTVELADMVSLSQQFNVPGVTERMRLQLRPFFPALARLPKAWSLLYSLDQHGISLNTLYGRCQDFKGSTLMVVRDSQDAVFGAWMGEGIHPSKGAYYGSGES